jgi:hypothetical protein
MWLERFNGEIYSLFQLESASKNIKKKKRGKKQYKCNWEVAPSKGFEPLTDWLTASRSTGLSHDGTLLTAFDFKYTI